MKNPIPASQDFRTESSHLEARARDRLALSKSKTNWLFGDWEKLVELDLTTILRHPDRDRFALLVGSAYQQLGDSDKARAYTQMALQWGCPPRLAARVLIGGVHNTLARASALKNDSRRTANHFQLAISAEGRSRENELISHVRSLREIARLGLLDQAVSLLGNTFQIIKHPSNRQTEISARLQAVEQALEFLNREILLGQQKLRPHGTFTSSSVQKGVSGTLNDPTQQTVYIKVHEKRLLAPQGHIYTTSLPVEYDYGPWRLIHRILKNANIEPTLVDIGGNIGDSVIHWRHYFTTKVISIEPDNYFYSLLRTNLESDQRIQLLNALVCPTKYSGHVVLRTNSSTGWSEITSETSTRPYGGRHISVQELLHMVDGPCVVKTDTDGFDWVILQELVDLLEGSNSTPFIPLIFAEGPTEEMMRSSEYHSFLAQWQRLQQLEYNLLLFSNYGTVYCYCGDDYFMAEAAMSALSDSFANERRYCHYFDALFIHREILPGNEAIVSLLSDF